MDLTGKNKRKLLDTRPNLWYNITMIKVYMMSSRDQYRIKVTSSISDEVTMDIFQSYDKTIVSIIKENSIIVRVLLDEHYWDYSISTGKYRNKFLGETKKETEQKIKSGEYVLTDLNKG